MTHRRLLAAALLLAACSKPATRAEPPPPTIPTVAPTSPPSTAPLTTVPWTTAVRPGPSATQVEAFKTGFISMMPDFHVRPVLSQFPFFIVGRVEGTRAGEAVVEGRMVDGKPFTWKGPMVDLAIEETFVLWRGEGISQPQGVVTIDGRGSLFTQDWVEAAIDARVAAFVENAPIGLRVAGFVVPYRGGWVFGGREFIAVVGEGDRLLSEGANPQWLAGSPTIAMVKQRLIDQPNT